MFLSSLTAVGFCANMMLDRREQAPFTIEVLHAAIERREVIPLLLQIDDSGMLKLCTSDDQERSDLNTAICDAGEALQGRELRKAGVGENVLCFVLAYVFEAIQQNFR